MTKILLGKKFNSKNPFTKLMQKNITERFVIYHEDWVKFEKVKQKWIEEGYKVVEYEVKENAEI